VTTNNNVDDGFSRVEKRKRAGGIVSRTETQIIQQSKEIISIAKTCSKNPATSSYRAATREKKQQRHETG